MQGEKDRFTRRRRSAYGSLGRRCRQRRGCRTRLERAASRTCASRLGRTPHSDSLWAPGRRAALLWRPRSHSGILEGGSAASGRVPGLARGRDSGRRACRGRPSGGTEGHHRPAPALADLPQRAVLRDRMQLQPPQQRRSGRVPAAARALAQPHVHREPVRERRDDVRLADRRQEQLRIGERLVRVLDADPLRRAERRHTAHRDRLLRESLAPADLGAAREGS